MLSLLPESAAKCSPWYLLFYTGGSVLLSFYTCCVDSGVLCCKQFSFKKELLHVMPVTVDRFVKKK
jgi:hypothetical protein